MINTLIHSENSSSSKYKELIQLPFIPVLALFLGLFSTVISLIHLAVFPHSIIAYLSIALLFVFFLCGRFFCCGVLLGVISIYFNAPSPYSHEFLECKFKVTVNEPNLSASKKRKSIRLLAKEILCKDNISLPNQIIQHWGKHNELINLNNKVITAQATLKPVHSRLNPYSFDYEKYLLSESILLTTASFEIKHEKPDTNMWRVFKGDVNESITSNLSSKSASIILALITGNRTALTDYQKNVMQSTGTSHLMAISGLHLALVGGGIWFLFQCMWALSWRLSDWLYPRNAGAVMAFLGITLYALFTGFDVPIQRAWIMFSLLILSWLLGRGLSQSSLIIAGCAVITLSPYSVVSIGFYFSFLATWVVIIINKLPYRPIIKILIMQLAINVAILPIVWWAFDIIPLSAFFVNLLVIPWLGLWVLPWAIIALVFSFSFIHRYLWQFVDISTQMMWETIVFAEQLNITIHTDSRPHIITVSLCLIMFFIFLVTQKKLLLFGLLVLFIPVNKSILPAIIVADRSYSSSLIHNGKTAIIINPGRKYRKTNNAKMWHEYLRNHQLELGAIILQNGHLNKISSTKWLIDKFPKTKVITLSKFDTPYISQYCQSLSFGNLTLSAKPDKKNCLASINWLGKNIELFNEKLSTYSIKEKGKVVWNNNIYNTKQLGAVTININSVHYEREKNRLWRKKVNQDVLK